MDTTVQELKVNRNPFSESIFKHAFPKRILARYSVKNTSLHFRYAVVVFCRLCGIGLFTASLENLEGRKISLTGIFLCLFQSRLGHLFMVTEESVTMLQAKIRRRNSSFRPNS